MPHSIEDFAMRLGITFIPLGIKIDILGLKEALSEGWRLFCWGKDSYGSGK